MNNVSHPFSWKSYLSLRGFMYFNIFVIILLFLGENNGRENCMSKSPLWR